MTRIASGSRALIQSGEPDTWPRSDADRDSILNLGDARRSPSHLLGLLPLRPRPNAAFESVRAALRSGEQHGFRKAENIKRALDAERYFYVPLVLRSGLHF
jgi:hypothetical protein